jgi:hypothetical protein
MEKRVRLKRMILRLVSCAVVILFMTTFSFTQSTLVTVEGTIVDEQGNPLPGAEITIRNTETGYLYSVLSRNNGVYVVSGIQPGNYEIGVKLPGFESQKRSGLVFNVGARLTINFTMKPSALQEEITVTAPAPLIESSKSEISGVVDRKKIDDLPLLDRDFTSLAVLKAGVQEENRSNAMPRGNEEILLDGVSNEWVGTNIVRSTIPADAIEEFRVLTNQYQAEYGNASGMILNAITRSGTNNISGRVSFFYRDQAFDAVNYFVNHAGYKGEKLPKGSYEKTPFDHYNFSTFLGGPIIKDKLHFFLAYEGLIQNNYATVTSPLVPKETVKQPTHNHQFLAKFNYQMNDKNLFTFRYTLNRSKLDNQQVGGLFTASTAFTQKKTIDEFQLNWTYYPSNNTINEFRTLYSRTRQALLPGGDPDSYYIQRPSGNFGKLPNVPQDSVEKRFQFVENFSAFLGDHTLKMGFDFSTCPLKGYVDQYKPGMFIFTTDAPFNPDDFSTYPLIFLYNTGESTFNSPYIAAAAFVQDTWKVIPRLILNVGLRYNWYKCKGLDLDIWNLANLNPRFGFSYDLTGDGKTKIRGGAGTFSANPILNAGLIAYFMNQVRIQTIIYPNYPDPFQPNPFFPSIPGSLTLAEYKSKENIVSPHSFQATFGLERVLTSDLTVSADLIWTKGLHLLRLENQNGIIPGTGYERPDMTKGDVFLMADNGKSKYKALYFNLNKRYSHGWALEFSYTLSKSESDVESELDTPHSNEPDAWKTQWGPTNYDARHRLTLTGIVDLPLGFQLSGLVRYRSKLPWTALYPNDVNLDGIVEDYVDSHRNARRGFDEFTINVRISKYLNLNRLRMQFFGEIYNLTNRANFSEVFNFYGLPGFGDPTVAGDPRLIQLGIRFDF